MAQNERMVSHSWFDEAFRWGKVGIRMMARGSQQKNIETLRDRRGRLRRVDGVHLAKRGKRVALMEEYWGIREHSRDKRAVNAHHSNGLWADECIHGGRKNRWSKEEFFFRA